MLRLFQQKLTKLLAYEMSNILGQPVYVGFKKKNTCNYVSPFLWIQNHLGRFYRIMGELHVSRISFHQRGSCKSHNIGTEPTRVSEVL